LKARKGPVKGGGLWGGWRGGEQRARVDDRFAEKDHEKNLLHVEPKIKKNQEQEEAEDKGGKKQCEKKKKKLGRTQRVKQAVSLKLQVNQR